MKQLQNSWAPVEERPEVHAEANAVHLEEHFNGEEGDEEEVDDVCVGGRRED